MLNTLLSTTKMFLASSGGSGFKLQFNPGSLSQTIPVMLMGMAGIFIALLIIYGACIVLQKVFPANDEDEK